MRPKRFESYPVISLIYTQGLYIHQYILNIQNIMKLYHFFYCLTQSYNFKYSMEDFRMNNISLTFYYKIYITFNI